MSTRLPILLCLATSLATAAESQLNGVALTIYNDNLALVEETRNLPRITGPTRVEFKGVSASIRPETVTLAARGLTIVEQNFDYDLLTPAKLMEKAVGKTVKIVRINPGNGAQETEAATVLSVNDGVVLKIGGRIEVLRADAVPTRVIFDEVPDNLRANPTLSITLDGANEAAQAARLSYLSRGLSWQADYVAVFAEAAQLLNLQGWITLQNSSGTSFADAAAQLIAGQINQVDSDQDDWRYRQQADQSSGFRPAAGMGDTANQLADYYVYPIAQPTTVADNQTKQVSFLAATGLTAAKRFQFTHPYPQTQSEPQQVDVSILFNTVENSGLGAQLPAGVVRVYVQDAAGAPKFIGEDRIEHTPAGAEVSVTTGKAFDVTVQPTLVSSDARGWWNYTYAMRYKLTNAKAEAVVVDVRQGGFWHNARVVTESHPSRAHDAYNFVWPVEVPARGEATLEFTVSTRW